MFLVDQLVQTSLNKEKSDLGHIVLYEIFQRGLKMEGISQNEFLEQTGISRSSFSRYLHSYQIKSFQDFSDNTIHDLQRLQHWIPKVQSNHVNRDAVERLRQANLIIFSGSNTFLGLVQSYLNFILASKKEILLIQTSHLSQDLP